MTLTFEFDLDIVKMKNRILNLIEMNRHANIWVNGYLVQKL